LNYKHLHYFWMAARAGGVMRAAEQLHVTPQTLSEQIKLLEDRLGRPLFKRVGRQIELTDDGRLVMGYADEIFSLGRELEAAVRQGGAARTLEFRVGVADSVPKSMAYRLLEPALEVPEPVRLIAEEGRFEDLLARLAVHRLDLVVADEPLRRTLSVKAFNHALGSTPMSFFAAQGVLSPEQLARGFPQCLEGAPMLLPGAATPNRSRIEAWIARHGLRPQVVAEFDDGALMKAFGREGRGVFAAPSVLQADTQAQYGVSLLGTTDEVVEEFFAISAERRITHPCVAAITARARGLLAAEG
jgi:LysR family transcriptional activator of nhaA